MDFVYVYHVYHGFREYYCLFWEEKGEVLGEIGIL